MLLQPMITGQSQWAEVATSHGVKYLPLNRREELRSYLERDTVFFIQEKLGYGVKLSDCWKVFDTLEKAWWYLEMVCGEG